MQSILFLTGCIFTILAMLAVLDWSAQPCRRWPEFPGWRTWATASTWRAYAAAAAISLGHGWRCHLRGIYRLCLFAGAAIGAAYAAEGWSPPVVSVIFIWVLCLAYALQAHKEARRQRDEAMRKQRRAST